MSLINRNIHKFPEYQNGRVVNVTAEPTEWFQLTTDNKPNNDFKSQALMGILSSSPLTNSFFSKQNIKLLQDMIRYNVYKQSNNQYVIGEQSNIELEIIMRGIFLQYSKNLQNNITEQIKELNTICMNHMVPIIITNIKQYEGYIWEVEHNPVPIDLPVNISNAGTRLLKSVTTTF